MKQIELAAIAVNASTQTRASIAESVVADYAERMLDGAQFPAVVLFHDGNQYYIGDGFHRVLASQRNGAVTISSDVRPGTREDALWFALGANREHGHQMTVADKKHAILVALHAWPDRSMREIADQIGCSRKWISDVRDQQATTRLLATSVVGRDGKTYPSKRGPQVDQRPQIEALLRDGVKAQSICKKLGVSSNTVTDVRRSIGGRIDTSRAAINQRMDTMRTMADEGHTSRQIAAAVGMTTESCRNVLRDKGIVVVADKAVGSVVRHNSNRIVESMVLDAENLTADVNLIEFDAIDQARITPWLRSLIESRDKLGGFIRRLMKEQQKHGEAA